MRGRTVAVLLGSLFLLSGCSERAPASFHGRWQRSLPGGGSEQISLANGQDYVLQRQERVGSARIFRIQGRCALVELRDGVAPWRDELGEMTAVLHSSSGDRIWVAWSMSAAPVEYHAP